MASVFAIENSNEKIIAPKCAGGACCMVSEFMGTTERAKRGVLEHMAADTAEKLQSAINRACAACRGYEI